LVETLSTFMSRNKGRCRNPKPARLPSAVTKSVTSREILNALDTHDAKQAVLPRNACRPVGLRFRLPGLDS
jgi:hypothetical protein